MIHIQHAPPAGAYPVTPGSGRKNRGLTLYRGVAVFRVRSASQGQRGNALRSSWSNLASRARRSSVMCLFLRSAIGLSAKGWSVGIAVAYDVGDGHGSGRAGLCRPVWWTRSRRGAGSADVALHSFLVMAGLGLTMVVLAPSGLVVGRAAAR